jgi:hypothetical protein
MRASNRHLIIIASLITAGGAVIAHAASSPPAPADSITYENACTGSERWLPEKNALSRFVQNRIELTQKGVKNGTPAAQSLLRALAVNRRKPLSRAAAIADYWTARALFESGLILQARQAFNKMVLTYKTDETFPFRSAAMSCLGRIHDKYPTLTLDSATLTEVQALLTARTVEAKQKVPFYESVLWSLERAGSDSEAKALSEHLKDGGFFEKVSTAILALRAGDDAGVVRQIQFMADPLFARFSKPKRETWKLIFSMGLFNLKKRESAAYLFNRVSNTSNVFVAALAGEAWSYLGDHRYEEAIGAASNLVVGGLKKTFAPEGFETLSIALVETCNYSPALEALRWFRRAYEKPHRYLANLQAKGDSADLYQLVTSFLQGKSDVPERVGIEWIGDPIFLANQAEINAQIESVEAIEKMRKGVDLAIADPKAKTQVAAWTTAWNTFSPTLEIPADKSAARKEQLIKEIQKSLRERNRQMSEKLDRIAENLQRVEAEAYESIGDRFIAETGPGGASSKAKDTQKLAKSKKNEGAVWDWGAYKSSDDDNGEVWEDELGALRANLKKTCETQ